MKRYTYKKAFRLDDKTLDIMKKNMTDRDINNESEYIRTLICFDHIDNMNFDKKEFMKIRRVLAGAGNNLNQIAHHMNMNIYSSADQEELDRCMENVKEMRKQLDKIIKVLF